MFTHLTHHLVVIPGGKATLYENRLEGTRLTLVVVSLLERQSIYSGGADSNTACRSPNFYNIQGTIKRLAPGNIFFEGSGVKGVLVKEVMWRLTAQDASMIQDGNIKRTIHDLSVFNLTARGLSFTPYAVASYVEATFSDTVYRKLEGLLEPIFLPRATQYVAHFGL